MNDPSLRVAPPLLSHLHLLSTIKYPHQPQQLPPDNVLSHLLQAPRIIREAQPVSWQFLTPPPDGTVLLAWQPTAQRGTTFASDGYVWAEPEITFTNEVRGHLIESLVQESGYIPGHENVASHRRIRSRILRGPPSASIDPQLELVQWLKAKAEHTIPVNAIRVSPQTTKLLMDRTSLMRQGGLKTRPFMFPDVNNWPTVNAPQHAGNPYQQQQQQQPPPNVMGARSGRPSMVQQPGPQPVMNHPQQRPGAPPAKRARTGTASQGMPPHRGSMVAADEAILAAGDERPVEDLLDVLSPRDISVTRFKQHQAWMEEIMSAYDVREILPVALGLGLTGELADITKGILDRETEKEDESIYKPLTSEQTTELEKRVAEFRKQGEEQIADMKRKHTAKVDELSQQKLFARLERQLAEVGQTEYNKVEQLGREAEKAGPIRVLEHDEIVRMSKGGLLAKGEEAPRAEEDEHNGLGGGNSGGEDDNNQMTDQTDMFGDFANLDNTAAAELDFYDGMNYS